VSLAFAAMACAFLTRLAFSGISSNFSSPSGMIASPEDDWLTRVTLSPRPVPIVVAGGRVGRVQACRCGPVRGVGA
jgi:hypothetical protein